MSELSLDEIKEVKNLKTQLLELIKTIGVISTDLKNATSELKQVKTTLGSHGSDLKEMKNSLDIIRSTFSVHEERITKIEETTNQTQANLDNNIQITKTLEHRIINVGDAIPSFTSLTKKMTAAATTLLLDDITNLKDRADKHLRDRGLDLAPPTIRI